MPNAAKKFGHEKPRPSKRVLGKHNYGRAWTKFREWFASVHPAICVDCGAALESKRMHLDHDPPLQSATDPGLCDETRVKWRCVCCHSKRTVQQIGGKIE